MLNEKRYFQQHDDILNSHIPYGGDANTSPHIVVNHWFDRIEKNCIVVNLIEEEKYSKQRKIFYKVDRFGDNVKYNIKKKFLNLNVEGTKNNRIFIVVKYKEVMNIDRLSFFTETGNLIDSFKLHTNWKGYVILATVQCEQAFRNSTTKFTVDDVSLVNRYLRNQTKSTHKEYYSRTTGNIYGFGYGPVYSSNCKTKYTIDRFATSKFRY